MATTHGWRTYGRIPGGVGARPRRQRQEATFRATASGSRMRGTGSSARRWVGVSQPDGATLTGPSRPADQAVTTAAARSTTCRYWAGVSSRRGHVGGGVERPGQPAAPPVLDDRRRAQAGHGGRRVVRRPVGRDALDLRQLHGVGQVRVGRSGASSVSGTGLLAHGP